MVLVDCPECGERGEMELLPGTVEQEHGPQAGRATTLDMLREEVDGLFKIVGDLAQHVSLDRPPSRGTLSRIVTEILGELSLISSNVATLEGREDPPRTRLAPAER